MSNSSEISVPHADAASARTTFSSWIAPAALLVAVVAAVLAIWALTSSPSKAPDVQTSGESKLSVCTAFNTVSKAVSLQTHADLGPEPTSQAAVAANARLSMVGGGQYLLNRVDSATAPELATAMRAFAGELQDIGMNALAGLSLGDPAQADLLIRADSSRKNIAEMCK